MQLLRSVMQRFERVGIWVDYLKRLFQTDDFCESKFPGPFRRDSATSICALQRIERTRNEDFGVGDREAWRGAISLRSAAVFEFATHAKGTAGV